MYDYCIMIVCIDGFVNKEEKPKIFLLENLAKATPT